MEKVAVARTNHVILCTLLRLILAQQDFKRVMWHGIFDAPPQYTFERSGLNGYIRFDTSLVISKGALAEDIDKGLFRQLATNIPQTALGEMNEQILVMSDLWRFTFTITQYERDSEHGYKMVDDPLLLPDNETLGRVIVMQANLNV